MAVGLPFRDHFEYRLDVRDVREGSTRCTWPFLSQTSIVLGMTDDNGKLSIAGVGTYLPPSVSTLQVAAAQGGDIARYGGWERHRVAGEEDHPSTMGARALQEALENAASSADDLALIVFVGTSRDYLPSWSVATEIARLLGIPGTCLGLDLQVGCLGLLPALEICESWLRRYAGRHAAIVAAERWSHTVDRGDKRARGMWGHSDGAGAIVGTLSRELPVLARFEGSRYITWNEDNDAILVKYGGTRFPSPPPGMSPHTRTMTDRTYDDPMQILIDRYLAAVRELQAGIRPEVDAMICNQIAPRFVERLASASGLDLSAICVTGHDHGHVGSVDLILGLQELRVAHRLEGSILAVASSPYAVGAGAFSGSL